MSFFRRMFKSSDDSEQEQSQDAEAASMPEAEVAATDKAETPASETAEEPVEESAPAAETQTTESSSRPDVEEETISDTPPPDIGATRQLPSETVISVNNAHVTYGLSTDVGLARSHNEDAVFGFFTTQRSVKEMPDFGLFVVADGMGGHNEGERASAIAINHIASYLIRKVYMPILAGTSLSDLPPVTEVLTEVFKAANEEVHKSIPKGGGTTCTAVMVLGDRAYIGHVGDSRAYLINNDEIEQLTRDHSVVQRLIELGQLTQEEAANHPRGSELYRAMGFKDLLDIDVFSRRLPPNSRLVLCSDGLWNHVAKPMIKQTVLEQPTPQSACSKLVAMANEGGGTDNITVIVAHR